MATVDFSKFPHLVDEEDRKSVLAMVRALGESVTMSILATPVGDHMPVIKGFHAFITAQVEQERREAESEVEGRAKSLEVQLSQVARERDEAAARAVERDARVQGLKGELNTLRAQGNAHVQGLEQQLAVTKQALTALSRSAAPQETKKAVRLDVAKFDGSDGNKLVHWLLAVERAAAAQLIKDDEQTVSLALSHLRGRASEWAYSTLLADQEAFGTWETFKRLIREVYQPPNHEAVLQSRFFAARQGKRTLMQYVQEMRTLAASITLTPLAESVKVPAFVNGLSRGPARQQLYRKMPDTMEEAIRIALIEDQSFNAAGQVHPGPHKPGQTPGGPRGPPRGGGGPEPMDLSNADIICHSCGKRGHIASRCYARMKRQGNTPGTPRPSGSNSNQRRSSFKGRQQASNAMAKFVSKQGNDGPQ